MSLKLFSKRIDLCLEMKKTPKKTYTRPRLITVELDMVILLQAVSDGAPPDQPPFSSSSQTTTTTGTQKPLKESNFEDNPFER
jgi:hypothetical protein